MSCQPVLARGWRLSLSVGPVSSGIIECVAGITAISKIIVAFLSELRGARLSSRTRHFPEAEGFT